MSALAPSGVAGWRAELSLRFDRDGPRTRLAHRVHRGPLLVQRAFHPEPQSGACHVYVIHPPGGVVSGDQLDLQVTLEPEAEVLLTTPAAGKFYRRGDDGLASQLEQRFDVQDATLEWLPQENIYYPDAAVELTTRVMLSGRARFIGWEVGCLGLPARNESIADGRLRQRFELYRDGVPLLLERLSLDAEGAAARWGLAGDNTLGTLLAYPADAGTLDLARGFLESDCADASVACTLVDGVLVCRGMEQRADRLRGIFDKLWRRLRPALLGRAALAPRIWAT